jgi:hypothetical protein
MPATLTPLKPQIVTDRVRLGRAVLRGMARRLAIAPWTPTDGA